MARYTTEEVQLNKEILKQQNRAKRLILSDKFDSIKLSEMQDCIFKTGYKC